MSLRVKIVFALLTTSLLALALVWAVAYHRLTERFNDIVLTHAARNFRGDVASYWLTYGSWDAGKAVEAFPNFVQRRKALLFDPRQPPIGPQDTGDAADAKPLPPVSGLNRGRPEPEAPRPRQPPPFRFLLFDPDGRVLNSVYPPNAPEIPVSSQDWARAVPITVSGKVVAYASPVGKVNYSPDDRAYIRALQDALTWGIGAAAVMAAGLGLVFGTGLARSVQRLTRAIEGIEGGTLRQRVEISSRDEVGRLAQAFNRMSDALQASHQTISAQAEQMRELAERDALTKLFNRRHFDAHTLQMYEQAIRYGRPLSVMIGDIDFFKRVNDQFSHAIGDRVLQEVGRLLCDHVRPSDLVARYGGEEFVIAFPETSLADAADGCERVRRRIEAHPWHEIHPELRITISMGISDDLSLGSIEAMLKAADTQLYEAKRTGRNRVAHGAALAMNVEAD